MAKKTAVIIIPTYNERENVQVVVAKLAEIFKSIQTWDMQVLVVDDTSPDKTYDVVKTMQKKYRFLHLLVNKQKAGLGGAYLKGMARAFGELKADAVFEFDADLSHDPERIPDFLTKLDEGYDLVLGSRYIPGGSIPADWGLHRKFMSVVGNLVIMFVLADFSVHDWTTGYRAITRRVYDAVKAEMSSERFTGYTFQIGFLHKTVRKGFKVAEVPFHFVDRTIGESKLGLEYIKNSLMYIARVRLQEILASRIFKFVVVGGVGTLIQLTVLQIMRALLPTFTYGFLTNFLVATAVAIEAAIISNFTWNNLWTFNDRRLKPAQIPGKFLAFNGASMGSVVIQLIVNGLGERFIGLYELFRVPVVNYGVDTGQLFAMAGILIGLFWNYFAYSFFIWKKPPSS